jgi:hypothetical protein
MKKRYYLAFLIIFSIWAAYVFFMYESLGSLANKGLFGDSFGALSSLFSGLALAGLIINILQQQDEIAKLGQEQILSRNLLDEQIKVLRATARLNYLNDVIARQRKLIDESPDDGGYESAMWHQRIRGLLQENVDQREVLVRSLES